MKTKRTITVEQTAALLNFFGLIDDMISEGTIDAGYENDDGVQLAPLRKEAQLALEHILEGGA